MKKPKNVEIGPRVTLDDERCILCSRCIRFCKEIAKDDVLGFIDRGSHSTLTAHPGKRLENNYSLNTVDICPVGALTSIGFPVQDARLVFEGNEELLHQLRDRLQHASSARAKTSIYRQTPRENDAVNSCWMCDYGRLNFDYLQSAIAACSSRLVRDGTKLQPADWKTAIEACRGAASKHFVGWQIAIIASGRMTNEELWLTARLAQSLGVQLIDIVPRTGPGDDILLSADRNPNTNGARTSRRRYRVSRARSPASRSKRRSGAARSRR